MRNKKVSKVNMTKTKVTRPSGLKYLRFGFWKDSKDGKWKARPHQDSVTKFKRKLKELTKRSWSVSMGPRTSTSPFLPWNLLFHFSFF